MLDNDVAAWIISFQTQEILLFRNAKTMEVAVGAEDKVEQCQYVAVLTRTESKLDDEITGGWKVIEVRISHKCWSDHLNGVSIQMARRSSRAFL
jgi:mitochondrial import inner membrane translocase subunit TIM44